MAPERSSPADCRWLLVAALLLTAVPTPALAADTTMFTCVANGRTYSGDRPPPECANSDIRELNRDGSLKRLIARPLTVEEQRLRALEARRKADEDERALAQRRRDRALLETYASETEIEAARAKALASTDVSIRVSEDRLAGHRAEGKRLQDETEFYKKREVPENLKRSMVTNEQLIRNEEKIIADIRAERGRINERFDRETHRFHELVAAGARPVERGRDLQR